MDPSDVRAPQQGVAGQPWKGSWRHDEFKFYWFGLRAGISNLISNRWSLGVKKTLGKITQPINSHTRFPEYRHFENAIDSHLAGKARGQKIRILDVGSPKLFGLYLAVKLHAEVVLTDVSPLNIDEYRVMWQSLQPRARGQALFLLQDARSLDFQQSEFDVVYSMSVIEHIESTSGDSEAVREMLRVLKPGGLLVLSVPFASAYMEQQRIGFSGAVRDTGDSTAYFFQRIYDVAALENRILRHAGGLKRITLKTAWRENSWAHKSFCFLGQNVRGALGFVNPVLSKIVNRSRSDINHDFPAQYGAIHSARDTYGDVIISGLKS